MIKIFEEYKLKHIDLEYINEQPQTGNIIIPNKYNRITKKYEPSVVDVYIIIGIAYFSLEPDHDMSDLSDIFHDVFVIRNMRECFKSSKRPQGKYEIISIEEYYSKYPDNVMKMCKLLESKKKIDRHHKIWCSVDLINLIFNVWYKKIPDLKIMLSADNFNL